MGEEGRVRKIEGTIWKPMVELEGGRGPIIDFNSSNGTIGIELVGDDFPEVTMAPIRRSIE